LGNETNQNRGHSRCKTFLLTDNLTEAKTFISDTVGIYHLHFAGVAETTACWDVVAGGEIELTGRVYEHPSGAVLVALKV
jgi:hypothetical protein